MDKISICHSFKDIPIPSKKEYLIKLLEKTENLIGRMRWKAFFYLQPKDPTKKINTKNNYGFKTQKSPPFNKLLQNFEYDLLGMIKKIEFKEKSSKHQMQLIKQAKKINESPNIYMKADKTNNIYEMPFNEYDKIMKSNITKNYKKTNQSNNMEKIINDETKKISEELNISDRVGTLIKKESYALIKDHKTNYINDPKIRMICPARPDIGKISAKILKNVVSTIKTKLKLNLWTNTKDAIEWFTEYKNLRNPSFIQFDINDFYPSISKNLFDKVIDFAKLHAHIEDKDLNIINQCRNTAIYYKNEEWVKKENSGIFDITMGSLDSSNIADLVGLYILSTLDNNNKIQYHSAGLYRDDGLLIINNSNGPKCEKIKKLLIKELKDMGLKIEISTNLKIVNFLDVTMNLTNSTFKPYRKENSKIIYINTKSNHPPAVIKQIPKSIQKRLSTNSSNQNIFYDNIIEYQEALKHSGYTNTTLSYENISNSNSNTQKKRRSRKRNLIWYNPPYNLNIKNNIGKMFFNYIDKHFPPEHPLHKIFNRNTLKLSYSCTDNFEKIVKKHNNRIIRTNTTPKLHESTCSCSDKLNCPLNQNCKIKNIVYKATVSTKNDEKHYIGSAQTDFKKRLANHNTSFSNENYKYRTSLSTHIWKLKAEKIPYNIKWEIVAKAPASKSLYSTCYLCLSEKLAILQLSSHPNHSLINRRSEIGVKCRHRTKFLIKSWNENPT